MRTDSIHYIIGLKARASDHSDIQKGDGCLTVEPIFEKEHPNNLAIQLFMPYEAAEAYANAINTVNDREALDANENRQDQM